MITVISERMDEKTSKIIEILRKQRKLFETMRPKESGLLDTYNIDTRNLPVIINDKGKVVYYKEIVDIDRMNLKL